MTRLFPLICVLALLVGCSRERHVTVAEVLPQDAYATPWLLVGDVWSGDFDQASSALGDDAEGWAAFAPRRVWLAVYHHDTYPLDQIVVRVFAFDTQRDAHEAFVFFAPAKPVSIRMGDEACWTDDGVLLRWGRLVFEIFGRGVNQATPEQSMYVLALIEKRLDRELAENPR